MVKFIYSEKATKFCEIFKLLLTTVHTVKSKVKISQNFVAFSEYMNFTSGMKEEKLWETFSFFYVANGCYLTSFFLFFRKVPFWLSNMCKNSKKWSILIRPQELLTAASLLLEDTRHSLIGNVIGLRLEKRLKRQILLIQKEF